jgi:hypothetical protein
VYASKAQSQTAMLPLVIQANVTHYMQCMQLTIDTIPLQHRTSNYAMQLWVHEQLSAAAEWSEVKPSQLTVDLAKLAAVVSQYDAIVVPSTVGSDNNRGFVLEVARLSGVQSRIVDAGATGRVRTSERFTAATAFTAPSQYVEAQVRAYKPNAIVKVCILDMYSPCICASELIICIE